MDKLFKDMSSPEREKVIKEACECLRTFLPDDALYCVFVCPSNIMTDEDRMSLSSNVKIDYFGALISMIRDQTSKVIAEMN